MIAIPTYDRVGSLALLLRCLQMELTGLEDQVQVLVSYNASTDGTAAMIAKVRESRRQLVVQRHERNIGPEENFCSCVERIDMRYFWLIGDYDLPKVGMIRRVIDLLRECNPDLLYMHNEWREPLASASDGEAVNLLTVRSLTRRDFARQVKCLDNVHLGDNGQSASPTCGPTSKNR